MENVDEDMETGDHEISFVQVEFGAGGGKEQSLLFSDECYCSSTTKDMVEAAAQAAQHAQAGYARDYQNKRWLAAVTS